MKILFIAGRELSYQRNDVLLRAFSKEHQVTPIGTLQKPQSLVSSSILLCLKAMPKIIFEKYDLVYVGFYGYLILLLLRLIYSKPILFDAFTSNYDTLVNDRKTIRSNSILSHLAYWLDWISCHVASHILLDTHKHIDYFVKSYHLSANKLSAIPVGCNEAIFYKQPFSTRNQQTTVLYYSSYLPLHGVDIVVEAASLLRDENIIFRLIGDGLTKKQVIQRASELNLQNVVFLPNTDLKNLASEIAHADICLGGHFGSSEKAKRVIPGKIYQILAVGRPLIATNTPANLELLTPGYDSLLCAPGDAKGLARLISQLHHNPELRETLANRGGQLFHERCSETSIQAILDPILKAMIA
jgi:glycosyltransferase involved in cell wall biosynthesis